MVSLERTPLRLSQPQTQGLPLAYPQIGNANANNISFDPNDPLGLDLSDFCQNKNNLTNIIWP